ncbi:MAG: hypothetical protein KBF93_15315 [Leptospiraceae bacterium]|nr:hypothetical protein [Leptospiraceae bacterium]
MEDKKELLEFFKLKNISRFFTERCFYRKSIPAFIKEMKPGCGSNMYDESLEKKGFRYLIRLYSISADSENPKIQVIDFKAGIEVVYF